MSLQLDARLASRSFDVVLELGVGETLALVGANGAGKSTLVEVLAGLVRPDAGRAELAGRELFHLPDRWLPPHARQVALLAQDPLLFPHLGVVENVAFGPRSRGRSRAAARAVADRWLAAVAAQQFAHRRPAELSGGEAQRVALARALAAEPDLLLLDEPLAALDVAVAATVRRTLRQLLVGRTAILVTHEILDVVLLADRVVVLESGRVVESGPVADVVRRPRSAFGAKLCGVNLMPGIAVAATTIRAEDGAVVHGQPDRPLLAGEPAVAVFRPSAVSLHRGSPSGSQRNVFVGSVSALEPQAHLIRVHVGAISADVTPESVAGLGLVEGTTVHCAVKAAEVSLAPA